MYTTSNLNKLSSKSKDSVGYVIDVVWEELDVKGFYSSVAKEPLIGSMQEIFLGPCRS
eukprot:m.107390 g.107390  ORF g.107390 m.107390 type:complete len:58 (-) comp13926_c0_seq3:1948-2121(-)